MSCSWGRHVGGVISWGLNDRKSSLDIKENRAEEDGRAILMLGVRGALLAPGFCGFLSFFACSKIFYFKQINDAPQWEHKHHNGTHLR